MTTLEKFFSIHGYESGDDFRRATGCDVMQFYSGTSYECIGIAAIDKFVGTYRGPSYLKNYLDKAELAKRIKTIQLATKKFMLLKETAYVVVRDILCDTFDIPKEMICKSDIQFDGSNRIRFLTISFSYAARASDSFFKLSTHLEYYARDWKEAYRCSQEVNKFKLERRDIKH
jgi:hypothetical protein